MVSHSPEELKNIIEKILAGFDKANKAKDAKAMTEFYHPDAVLVDRGKWAVYGKKNIEAKYTEWLTLSTDFKVYIDSNTETKDGEYIVHKGRFEGAEKPEEFFHYQQIYQKQSDGSYLVYHEEFEDFEK